MKLRATTTNTQVVSWLLRIGLAGVFLYAGVDGLLEPDAWISYIPSFSNQFVDPKLALDGISFFQILLAGWLLSGKYLRVAAAVSVAMVGGIMLLNLDTLLITFRDFGLVFMALALLFIEEK